VAERVFDLTRSLSPSNQALLLSLFARSSPSCLRISRAVAYHVLTGPAIQPVSCALLSVHFYIIDVTFQASYALPPLAPLIAVLSDPDGPFSIRDSTDYDALTSRIAVLSVAMSGIDSYVAEESMRKTAQAAILEGSPRKKESTPLELFRGRMEAMHGKIGTSVSWLSPVVIQRFCLQSIPAPLILIGPEQRAPYNVWTCVSIINALP
jgi:hypothetical protein